MVLTVRCFENFAVLHDGSSRTPLFVAERLNLQILLAACQQTFSKGASRRS